MENKNIYEKLANIQIELKAPKGQYNKFGNYKYRSCEDILEAVKPLCFKNRTTLILNDEVEVKSERYYIKAIATLYDWDSENKLVASAYAREILTKKGMDDCQITGTASSYARKYALNGLFNIDDTKDNDTNESRTEAKEREKEADKTKNQTNKDDKLEFINKYYKEHKEAFGKFLKAYLKSNGVNKAGDLSENQKDEIIQTINNGKHTFED